MSECSIVHIDGPNVSAVKKLRGGVVIRVGGSDGACMYTPGSKNELLGIYVIIVAH